MSSIRNLIIRILIISCVNYYKWDYGKCQEKRIQIILTVL